MFDAHCHLNFSAFDQDREVALGTARDVGIRGLIIAGYDEQRRKMAAQLALRKGIWATAGIHPWALADKNVAWLERQLEVLRSDLENPQYSWCGIGELGLDYYRVRDEEGRALQQKAFVDQLGIARELNLPVVIHAVKCHNKLYDIMRREGVPRAGGMMHGYSGSAAQIGNFLMLNMDISIGTPITFDHSKKLSDVVRAVPDERLLVETDAPDRPPEQYAGQRNELQYLSLVIDEVARVRCQTSAEIAQMTERNARQRFQLNEEVLEDGL